MINSPAAFDPDRVAHFEAAGWRAYYDKKWLRVFTLIVRLNQAEFKIPFPLSLVASYHIARASVAWAPKDHDIAKVRRHLVAYYTIAAGHAGLHADAKTAGDLELRYWDIHRRLIGQEDRAPYVEAVADLHASLFGLSREAVHTSAVERVKASDIVDEIVLRRSTDPERDWVRLEQHLRKCYRSLAEALRAEPATEAAAS